MIFFSGFIFSLSFILACFSSLKFSFCRPEQFSGGSCLNTFMPLVSAVVFMIFLNGNFFPSSVSSGWLLVENNKIYWFTIHTLHLTAPWTPRPSWELFRWFSGGRKNVVFRSPPFQKLYILFPLNIFSHCLGFSDPGRAVMAKAGIRAWFLPELGAQGFTGWTDKDRVYLWLSLVTGVFVLFACEYKDRVFAMSFPP